MAIREHIKRTVCGMAAPFYQMAVWTRNRLYDLEVLRSSPTPQLTISVGNITAGGTGKTPHSEYLIRLLAGKYRLGYLSRGYKRKTKGLQIAGPASTSRQIGDEAMQVHRKFPHITVAVDSNRMRALSHIDGADDRPDIVILDDCYQHRRITPDISILLIDYNRLVYYDKPLPLGRLRESAKNTDRADFIIITKCPDTIQGVDKLSIRTRLSPMPFQNLFFSRMVYSAPYRAFSQEHETLDLRNLDLLAVSGIAQPQHLSDHLRLFTHTIHTICYNDHHNFSGKDIAEIEAQFGKLKSGQRAIIVTEKDLARMDQAEIPDSIRPYIYVLPIKAEIIFGEAENFDKAVEKMVGKKQKARR